MGYALEESSLQCHSLCSWWHLIQRICLSEIKSLRSRWNWFKTDMPYACGSQFWCFVLEKPLRVNRYSTPFDPYCKICTCHRTSCPGTGELRLSEGWANIAIHHFCYEIWQIFRSFHECLLRDCIGGSSGPSHASFSRRGVSCIKLILSGQRLKHVLLQSSTFVVATFIWGTAATVGSRTNK